jgi:predicted dehydrogenase
MNHQAIERRDFLRVGFDLLVNITSMPSHYAVNKAGLQAGRHVWSEKPMAPTVAQGRELLDLAKTKGLRIWQAPVVVITPQFRFMAAPTGRRGSINKAAVACMTSACITSQH